MRITGLRILVCILTLTVAVAATGPSVPDIGRVTRVLPAAELLRGKSRLVLRDNDQVAENDRVRTAANGRARIVLHDGSILSVGSSSQMILRSAPEGSQAGRVQLVYGKMRAQIISQLAARGPFELRTNTAVCGVLGTTVFIETNGNWSHIINFSDPQSGSQVRIRNVNPRVRGEVVLNPGEGTVVEGNKPPIHPHPMLESTRQLAFLQTDVDGVR
jgi:ferric-dicitrate binding protein FerR (iron transport regulator)